MPTPDRRLIIFAKWPEPGAVKTRLAADIGPQAAAALARAFLLDLRAAAEALPMELVLAYSPSDSRERFAALLGPRWRLWEQRGADLGARLAASLDRSARSDTVVIGSDSPWLTPDDLQAAFAALEAIEVVVGPCDDGGFYLLGARSRSRVNRSHPWLEILGSVRWSTASSLADLTGTLKRLRVPFRALRNGYDVDTVSDLLRLIRDLKHLPPTAMRATRAALATCGFAPDR